MIEPLIINKVTGGWETWVNPETESVAESRLRASGTNKDWYDGNLFRFWLDHENGAELHVVAVVDEKHYDIFNEDTSEPRKERLKHEMIEELRLVIGEDCWSPGGEQFRFSEFGEKLNKEFPMFEGEVDFRFSPDICVHPDGETWGWSS